MWNLNTVLTPVLWLIGPVVIYLNWKSTSWKYIDKNVLLAEVIGSLLLCYATTKLAGADWIAILFQILGGLALLGFILMTVGFQGEYMRSPHVLQIVIKLCVILIAAIPLLAALYSLKQMIMTDQGFWLQLTYWLLLLVACGGAALGLSVLNETVITDFLKPTVATDNKERL